MGERGWSRPGGLRELAGREVVLGPIVRRLAPWGLVGLGVLFRLRQYLAAMPFWLDEESLLENLRTRSWVGPFGPLVNSQLAPPGFLAVERLAYRVLGETRLSLRLFPFLGGVASLGLFLAVCRRCLGPTAVLIALGLFAVSNDLIAYSDELKQYETDVAAGLVCTWLGLGLRSRPVGTAELVVAGAVGAAIVWFSHPSAFVLAGVGTVLGASALGRRDGREAFRLALVGLTWAASFVAVYAVGLNQLGYNRDMWSFWAFAFPPVPPTSAWEAAWVPRRILFFFVNPLNFDTPLGPRVSILPALGFFGVGCLSLWRRDRLVFGLLAAPVLFTFLAAYLRLYPFHGRLVLFLVPTFLILIAEGAARVGERFGRRDVWAAVLASLLLFPTLRDLDYLVTMPRAHNGFNAHGDRRPSKLDPDRFPF
jgi:hypothetical protein